MLYTQKLKTQEQISRFETNLKLPIWKIEKFAYWRLPLFLGFLTGRGDAEKKEEKEKEKEKTSKTLSGSVSEDTTSSWNFHVTGNKALASRCNAVSIPY